MKKAIDSWSNFVVTRQSRGTAYVYKAHVTRFLGWIAENNRQPDRPSVEDYITEMLTNKRAKTTANVHMAALKSFFTWYCPRYHTVNPTIDLKLFDAAMTKPKHQRFLTEEEHKAVLLIARDGVEVDTFEFLCNTGLRRSEYHVLTPACISEDGKQLLVKGGKGGKDREVPINARVRDILDRNIMAGNAIRCVSYWNRADYLYVWCQSLARRAGVLAFGPHALRHYFATALIKNGVPLKIVSRILGHCSVLVTERIYCHLLPDDITGATDCLC